MVVTDHYLKPEVHYYCQYSRSVYVDDDTELDHILVQTKLLATDASPVLFGAVRTSTSNTICVEGMASPEGGNSREHIREDFCDKSPPCLSHAQRNWSILTKLEHVKNVHVHVILKTKF